MFFFICHQINHYIFNSSDPNGSKNVRTLILGGILYILLHAYLFSESNPLYQYRYYFYYIFLLDAFVMATIYKLYYGTSILYELYCNSEKDNEPNDESEELDKKPNREIKKIKFYNKHDNTEDDTYIPIYQDSENVNQKE